MKLLNLTQGGNEWKAARAKHFTASEASIMMACSKNVSRNELLEMKATGTEQEFSDWFERNVLDKGHAVEALARPIAEEIIGEQLYPVTGVSDDDTLLASFDGLTMLEDVCWECKQFNAEKAALIDQGVMPEVDKWQVVQQLVVSGADKCLYMVTDGTQENTRYLWVTLKPGDAEQLLAGWKQFEEDRQNYTHQETKPEPVAKVQQDLPALVVELAGEVRSSNLACYQDIVLERIRSVSTDLKTDQDFADADATVKFFNKAEKELDTVKKQALGQTASIEDLFQTIDRMKEEMRTKRLELDKLVKARKQQIRADIIKSGNQALAQHIEDLDAQLGEFSLPTIAVDFAGSIKGKRTVATLQSAADDELARARIEATQAFGRIKANITAFEELVGEYRHLFHDACQLVQLEPDHMTAEVRSRIADHREAETLRQEAERERIRKEEAAKLQQAAVTSEPIAATHHEPAVTSPAAEQSPTQLHPHELIDVAVDDTITITRSEYDQLRRDSRLLEALKAQGVDNWGGYDAALEALCDAA